MTTKTSHRRAAPEILPNGRLASPAGPSGHWRIQSPITRGCRTRLYSAAEFYLLIDAVCAGVTASISARLAETAEDARRDEAWRDSLPAPLGFEPPRWRWQRPLLRVPAGMTVVAESHYTALERAMWSGSKRGFRIHGPEEPSARRMARQMAG